MTHEQFATPCLFGRQIGIAILLSPIAQWIGPDAPEQQVVAITRDADDLPTRIALVVVIERSREIEAGRIVEGWSHSDGFY